MSDDTDQQETVRWQRKLASQANNRAWALAEQAGRTAAEDEEMLQAAHAAAYFWKIVGKPSQVAHAHQLLAHVYAFLQLPQPALHHLQQSQPFFLTGSSAPWEVAFAQLVAAHVASAAGDRQEHSLRYQAAVAAVNTLEDAEEKSILEASLRVVPGPTA